MKYKFFFVLATILIVLSACSNSALNNKEAGHNMDNMNDSESQEKSSTVFEKTTNVDKLTGKEFTLVTQEAEHQLNDTTTVPVWTFGGSVPGSEFRVKLEHRNEG